MSSKAQHHTHYKKIEQSDLIARLKPGLLFNDCPRWCNSLAKISLTNKKLFKLFSLSNGDLLANGRFFFK